MHHKFSEHLPLNCYYNNLIGYKNDIREGHIDITGTGDQFLNVNAFNNFNLKSSPIYNHIYNTLTR